MIRQQHLWNFYIFSLCWHVANAPSLARHGNSAGNAAPNTVPLGPLVAGVALIAGLGLVVVGCVWMRPKKEKLSTTNPSVKQKKPQKTFWARFRRQPTPKPEISDPVQSAGAVGPMVPVDDECRVDIDSTTIEAALIAPPQDEIRALTDADFSTPSTEDNDILAKAQKANGSESKSCLPTPQDFATFVEAWLAGSKGNLALKSDAYKTGEHSGSIHTILLRTIDEEKSTARSDDSSDVAESPTATTTSVSGGRREILLESDTSDEETTKKRSKKKKHSRKSKKSKKSKKSSKHSLDDDVTEPASEYTLRRLNEKTKGNSAKVKPIESVHIPSPTKEKVGSE